MAKGGPDKGNMLSVNFAADREAAEYVLSIGGGFWANGKEAIIKEVAKLPQEPFALTGIYLASNKQIDDAGLAQFSDCKNLTSLLLDGTLVSDVVMWASLLSRGAII